MPKSKNVGTNIKRLRKSGYKGKQLVAVALAEARSAGNRKIKAPPKRKRR